MSKLNQSWRRTAGSTGFSCLMLAVLTCQARAQLAITEVMSDAATNHGPMVVQNQSDFWELTNYGPSPINLAGYFFSDSLETPLVPLVAQGDPRLIIAANQSLLLVRNKETTIAAQFW